jgi:hypothetical protein
MLWATTRERPTYFYDWDAVRSAIVLGDSLREHGEPDIEMQYQLAANVMAASAHATIQAGNDCVAAGAWAHPSAIPGRYARTWDRMRTLGPLIMVLLPRLEVCVARNAADRARRGDFAVPSAAVEFWHPLYARWATDPNAVVIDSSELSREETVAELERQVASYAAPRR